MIKLKKLVTVLLTLCLVLTILPSVSFSASAEGAVQRTKSLNLSNVMKDIVNPSENWKWNASEQTLVLSGVDFNVRYADAIILPPYSKIIVWGDNTISAPDGGFRGIYSDGGITVTGPGNLNIYGSDNAIQNYVYLDITLANLSATSKFYEALKCRQNQSRNPEDGDITITLSGNLSASGITARTVNIKTGGDAIFKPTVYGMNSINGWMGEVCLEAGGLIDVVTIRSGLYSDESKIVENKIIISGTISASNPIYLYGNVEVPHGKTLVNNGSLKINSAYNYLNHYDNFTIYGTLINNGTINNNGTIIQKPVSVTPSKLYVNGTDILQDYDHTVECGQGIAVYTPIDNTLTFTNASISKAYTLVDGKSTGIYADGSINLVINGKNEVVLNSEFTYGIYVTGGNVKSFGSGSISLTGKMAGIYIENGALLANNVIYAEATDNYGTGVLLKGINTLIHPREALVSRKKITNIYIDDGSRYVLYNEPGAPAVAKTIDGFTNAAKKVILNANTEYAENGDTTTLTFNAVARVTEKDRSEGTASLNPEAVSKLIAGYSSATKKLNIIINVTTALDMSKLDLVIPASIRSIPVGLNLNLKIVSSLGTLTYDNATARSIFNGAGGSDMTAKIEYVSPYELNAAQQAAIGYDYQSSAFVRTGIFKTGGDAISFSGSPKFEVEYILGNCLMEDGIYIENLTANGIITDKSFNITYDDEYYNVVYVSYPLSNNDVNIISYDVASGYYHPYYDTPENVWYIEPVVFVTMSGLMNGISDTEFSPNKTTTRGMLVTILYRLEGEPKTSSGNSFTDISTSAYYYKAVEWASHNGIVNGFGNEFRPNDILTREQMVTIFYRYAEYKGYDLGGSDSLASFGDSGTVQPYAFPAMQWAAANGIITGTNKQILPKNGATRAQIAAILERFVYNIML